MLCKNLFKIFVFINVIALSLGAAISPYSSTDLGKPEDEFEKQMLSESVEFLNDIFANQIDFFKKMKTSLKPETQRYKDIETIIGKLQQAKQEQGLIKKAELYRASFKEIDKNPILLNKRAETGLDDEEFKKVLEDSGLKDVQKNFLNSMAAYFSKMAKNVGNVLEFSVDQFIENM